MVASMLKRVYVIFAGIAQQSLGSQWRIVRMMDSIYHCEARPCIHQHRSLRVPPVHGTILSRDNPRPLREEPVPRITGSARI